MDKKSKGMDEIRRSVHWELKSINNELKKGNKRKGYYELDRKIRK